MSRNPLKELPGRYRWPLATAALVAALAAPVGSWGIAYGQTVPGATPPAGQPAPLPRTGEAPLPVPPEAIALGVVGAGAALIGYRLRK